jgi:Zn finger protein HypA/HybF involved in hydrogenase expression
MHEFAVVESVVQSLQSRLEQEGVRAVEAIRFRRGSAFSGEALCQAFEMLTPGTPMEGARLEIETVNLEFDCACGHQQVITNDDLVGHMFVCPGCGAVREVDEAHDLELLEVIQAAD